MKIKVNDRTSITLEQSDSWKINRVLDWGVEIAGCESYVYIFLTTWQSGDVFARVVHCSIDSETPTTSKLLRGSNEEITQDLNQLILKAGITW